MKEAAQVAQRRARDEEAAAVELQKAKTAMEKLNAVKTVEPVKFQPPVAPTPVKLKPQAPEPVAEKPLSAAPVAKKPAKKEAKNDMANVFGSFFGKSTPPAAKPVVKKGKAVSNAQWIFQAVFLPN